MKKQTQTLADWGWIAHSIDEIAGLTQGCPTGVFEAAFVTNIRRAAKQGAHPREQLHAAARTDVQVAGARDGECIGEIGK